MKETLFGHLVQRFSNSPENLATESLSFILNRSHVARDTFINFFEHLNIPLPQELRFETQASDNNDSGIPDLVGKNASGNIIFLGESKFWAGLTDNQPVTYLHRLIHANGNLLLFIAPAKRFSLLWPELRRRCSEANLIGEPINSAISEAKILQLQNKCFLVLVSWRVLLNTFQQAFESEGEKEMLANLIQLQGLCEQMDESAFLPLRSEELTNNFGIRIQQYCDLVDEITEKLINEWGASTNGLRATSTRATYLRYLNIQSQGCYIEFSPLYWQKYCLTPLWLGIKSNDWKYDAKAHEKLSVLEIEEPARLFREGDYLIIPLYLRTGVERPEIVDGVMQQISEIFKILTAE
jgi:hypothetical protein